MEKPAMPSEPPRKKIDLTLTGQELYVKHCKICHGIDGKLGLNGAKPLPESTLSLEAIEVMVRDGKGAMTPFHKILSEEEVRRVSTYAQQFANSQK